jgi:hypothetical protein
MRRIIGRFRSRTPSPPSRRRDETKFLALGAPLGFVLADGYVSQAWNEGLHFIYGLDRQTWFFVLCGVVIIGAFCLRGFGSRSSY